MATNTSLPIAYISLYLYIYKKWVLNLEIDIYKGMNERKDHSSIFGHSDLCSYGRRSLIWMMFCWPLLMYPARNF